jgi:biopolymer transport protein ExbD
MIFRHCDDTPPVQTGMMPVLAIMFPLLAYGLFSYAWVPAPARSNVLPRPPARTPGAHQLWPPIIVRLIADPDGSLNRIQLDERPLGRNFAALGQEVRAIVEANPASPDDLEVEIDCDYGLHYAYVVDTIAAVSAYTDQDGRTVKLIDKIKFSPPRTER